MEAFVYKDKKLLRCGYTTGTCAALAARAAVTGLVAGKIPKRVFVRTPSGKIIEAAVECPVIRKAEKEDRNAHAESYAECAVRKDAGDDYDVTNGILIFCRAEFVSPEGQERNGDGTDCTGGMRNQEAGEKVCEVQIEGGTDGMRNQEAREKVCTVQIEGGTGVGRVTKKGLNQPPGCAAINEVPRKMIRQAVSQVLEEAGEERPVKITVSVPDGEQIAEKTFNPVLGITGGISILGTTGIVEPMSEDALVETIHAHLRVLSAAGKKFLAAVPGNMGGEAFLQYMEEKSALDMPGVGPVSFKKENFVLCSNFIGRTIDLAAECGFSGLLFAGHLGKLVKLGNGIMNTHSREGDGRMDTLISCGLAAGADIRLLRQIQSANTTEEAAKIYREAGFLDPVLKILLSRIHRHLKRRAPEHMKIGILLFSLETGYLGQTEEAGEIVGKILEEQRILREKRVLEDL